MATNFTVLDTITEETLANYTRDMLDAAREYLLHMKRTARQAGFGEKCGSIIRDTVGYRFDNMPVADVLAAMAGDDFLAKYQKQADLWHAGLNKSAAEATLKKNAGLHEAASALTTDTLAFKRLVNALRVVCVRNQSWQEKGNHLALPWNGHAALLHFFNVRVTNNRRLLMSQASA